MLRCLAPIRLHGVRPAFFRLPKINQRIYIELVRNNNGSGARYLLHSLFLSRSSMHLFMCAIHSCFSVLVAAYTANDLVVVRISQPLRYSASIEQTLLSICFTQTFYDILTSIVFQSLQLYLFQWDDVLFVVFFFANDNVAINQDIVEQKELPSLRPLSAHLCQDTFSNEHPARNRQWLL